jgi:cyclohexadieny/prephenate dehydrogenase
MASRIDRLAIIGQGLIGSSITRAVHARKAAREVVVTDTSEKVRQRVVELGIGAARVAATSAEAAQGADLVILCVPVSQMAAAAAEIAAAMKPGAILSDVGSVKAAVVADILPHLPSGVSLVPAHPLAGTEFSGPDAGLPKLFVNRWCILTPPQGTDATAIARVRQFWEALGSQVAVMLPQQHDEVLAITSHLPQLIAFAIFHTGLRQEEATRSEVIKFSAGGFRDFTRIAGSNPTLWRDIFLANKGPVLRVLRQFITDVEACATAIEQGDGATLEKLFTTSRSTRRKVIDTEHISLKPDIDESAAPDRLIRPYASND